ncbi:MAG: hypothetical protein V3U69_02775 [Bacteroidota bacterium]
MYPILNRLRDGDRRSIGKANQLVADVLDNPALFARVFNAMASDGPIIRMRSADAEEKITAERLEFLRPYKKKLIQRVATIDHQQVRWHVAQMLPRLELSKKERADAVEILVAYLDDRSSIVKTFAMQALADLAERDINLQPRVLKLLR